MFKALSFITMLCGISSFRTPKQIIRPATAPLQNIDLFKNNLLTEKLQLSFLREAELKHGRIAMLASLIIPISEQFTDGLGINQFQELDYDIQDLSVYLIFVVEFISMIRGWQSPFDNKFFVLKDDYQPGDFGFGLWNKDEKSIGIQMDKELNNGRLAMIGVLGMIVQELVTGKQLF
jgi:light-harvesting complex I chlorophyll a/b binding protein 1